MTTTTEPTYGTVEYFTAKLAVEPSQHDRRVVLVGRLRACIEHGDLDAARNLLAAYDQLAERVVRCDRCGQPYDEAAGDGWCGLCPECADRTEVSGE